MKTGDFYERYWSEPDNLTPEQDPTTPERQKLLLRALRPLKNGSRVLDAGCGSGYFSRVIADAGFKVTGMDISSRAVERAKTLHPGLDFLVHSVDERLSFADGAFGAVWLTEVLEHVFDIHACLSEVNRVLEPEGYLILTVPYHGLLKNIAIALCGFERHFNPLISHVRFFTKRSLCECLLQAGFSPVYFRGIGRCWPMYKSMYVVAKKCGSPRQQPRIIG